MIKLVVFDLDGVLLDSKDIHYKALNRALKTFSGGHHIKVKDYPFFDNTINFEISQEEHLSTYDGLTTRDKLKKLTLEKKLPAAYHDSIWEQKQAETMHLFNNDLNPDVELQLLMSELKKLDIKIAVASNSIRQSVKIILLRLGLIEYVDTFISNEDVQRAKPYPEMYFKSMMTFGVLPKETLIIEDSHVGRQAAIDSGCHLLAVENREQVTLKRVMNKIKDYKDQSNSIKWIDKDLTVLIPMAGAGSRFEKAGYTFPKPLIEVHQKPMIQTVVENLNIEANYVFIVQKKHYKKYNLKYLLNLIAPDCKIVQVQGVTEGAACTTLLAKKYINNSKPLVIANSDQYIEWDANNCMYSFCSEHIDGGILTFNASHPKWSYAKLDENRFVSEVAEKKVISDHATCGVYYWKRGLDYVRYAEQMIEKDIRVNNEFYVCPVFNEAIQDEKKIRIKEVQGMWGLGTPEDLDYFLKNYKY